LPYLVRAVSETNILEPDQGMWHIQVDHCRSSEVIRTCNRARTVSDIPAQTPHDSTRKSPDYFLKSTMGNGNQQSQLSRGGTGNSRNGFPTESRSLSPSLKDASGTTSGATPSRLSLRGKPPPPAYQMNRTPHFTQKIAAGDHLIPTSAATGDVTSPRLMLRGRMGDECQSKLSAESPRDPRLLTPRRRCEGIAQQAQLPSVGSHIRHGAGGRVLGGSLMFSPRLPSAQAAGTSIVNANEAPTHTPLVGSGPHQGS